MLDGHACLNLLLTRVSNLVSKLVLKLVLNLALKLDVAGCHLEPSYGMMCGTGGGTIHCIVESSATPADLESVTTRKPNKHK